MIAAEEDPRSESRVDHARVLADPADTGVLRVDAFLHRPGVDVGAASNGVGDRSRIQAQQRVHPRADHVVVVVAPRVARDLRAAAIGASRSSTAGRCCQECR